MLVWCLECAEVNTSPQFLKIYIGYLLVSELSSAPLIRHSRHSVLYKLSWMNEWMKDGLEVCSWYLSSLSLRTHYCHLKSSASAIWHSTGSTHPNCKWTTKFRSQLTSHTEPSATSNMVTGPFREHLQAGTEMHLFSTVRRHWDIFMILVPDINIQTYLLTSLEVMCTRSYKHNMPRFAMNFQAITHSLQ